MILFVDDDIVRHLEFARRHPGAFQTASIVLAQYELNASPPYISEIWLDHDLGDSLVNGGYFDEATGRPCGTQVDTIRPLVDWLCASPTVPRSTPIRIHSWNIPAAGSMAAKLKAAGFTNVVRQPFSFGDLK